MNWQKIETAPAEKFVLVANPQIGRLPVVAWKVNGEWHTHDGHKLKPAPTYWMAGGHSESFKIFREMVP